MPVKKSPRGSSTGRGGGQGGRIVNTIVVPAYKENANIRSLTERVFTALDAHGMRDDTGVCVCVCVCVCVYTYIYIYLYIHIHTYIISRDR